MQVLIFNDFENSLIKLLIKQDVWLVTYFFACLIEKIDIWIDSEWKTLIVLGCSNSNEIIIIILIIKSYGVEYLKTFDIVPATK